MNLILVLMYLIPHHSTDDPTDSFVFCSRALYEWAACLVTTGKLVFAKYLARVMQSSSEFIRNDEQAREN